MTRLSEMNLRSKEKNQVYDCSAVEVLNELNGTLQNAHTGLVPCCRTC